MLLENRQSLLEDRQSTQEDRQSKLEDRQSTLEDRQNKAYTNELTKYTRILTNQILYICNEYHRLFLPLDFCSLFCLGVGDNTTKLLGRDEFLKISYSVHRAGYRP